MEPSDLFDRHLYEKGALLLHSIRKIIGDEAFRTSIQTYVAKHANGTAITEDLLTAFRVTSGKNLTQFFDEFFYRAGHPELRVTSHYDSKKKEAVMRVVQTHAGEPYHFPVKIAIYPRTGKTIVEEKWVNEKESVFTFKLSASPHNMVFDSEVSVLKGTITIKPREMWQFQLEKDTHVAHRISAANELAKTASEEDVERLEKAMKNDSFWGVRGEIALVLGTTRLQTAYLKIMHAFEHEKDNRVKQLMLRALGDYASHDIHDFLLKQTKHANSYLVPAEAYWSIGKSRNADKVSVLEKGLQEKSWLDLIAVGAARGLTALQTVEAMRVLVKYTHARYSNRLRQTIAAGLGVIGKGREEALWKLVELTKDPYINLQISAAAALGELSDTRAIPALEELQKGLRDPRVVRTALESIRKINGVLELPPRKEKDTEKKK